MSNAYKKAAEQKWTCIGIKRIHELAFDSQQEMSEKEKKHFAECEMCKMLYHIGCESAKMKKD